MSNVVESNNNNIDTNTTVNISKEEELVNFLIFLAKNASRSRFYPFPDFFRITSKQVTIEEGKKGELYTQEEYNNMKLILDTITDIRSVTTNVQKELVKYIIHTPIKMSYHGMTFCDHIKEYEFKYNPLKERILDSKYKKRWYLYHGSVLGNWHSIVKNGIRNMSDTKLMSYGKAHGTGVYLSNDLSISYKYGLEYTKDNKAVSTTACVAVVEILEDPEKYLKTTGIYVIPNDKVLILRYLYMINKNIASDHKNKLEFYKKLKKNSINSTVDKVAKRIESDLSEIEPHATKLEVNHPSYIFITNDRAIIIELILDGYPFSPPLIRLKYKLEPEFKPECKDLFTIDGIYLYEEFSCWSPIFPLDPIIKLLCKRLTKYEMTSVEYNVDIDHNNY